MPTTQHQRWIQILTAKLTLHLSRTAIQLQTLKPTVTLVSQVIRALPQTLFLRTGTVLSTLTQWSLMKSRIVSCFCTTTVMSISLLSHDMDGGKMTTPILPPYVPPFKPVPQVTPFTYRDGVTMLKKLDGLGSYINKVLVPFVND